MDYKELLDKTIKAAVLAGDEILKIYETNFAVEYKEDNSPITLADKNASNKIINELKHFNIPFVSEEEEEISFETRSQWNKLWMIDPLDGTREFVRRNGEFTVNIALIEDNLPTLGVIFSPVFKDLYFSAKGLGAFKINRHDFIKMHDAFTTCNLQEILLVAKKLPIVTNRNNYVVVASRSHLSPETFAHIENLKRMHNEVEIITTGSSIKMCLVAEGIANEYPRFGPTMEWDTAAGQAILQEANCSLMNFETNEPMLYNRPVLTNNWFIAKQN